MLLVGCSPGTAGVPLDGLGACRRRYYILYNVGLGTRMVWDGVDHVTVRRTYLFTTLQVTFANDASRAAPCSVVSWYNLPCNIQTGTSFEGTLRCNYSLCARYPGMYRMRCFCHSRK